MMLAVDLLHTAFIMLSYISSISTLLKVFNYKAMLDFFKCFVLIYWNDYVIFILHIG